MSTRSTLTVQAVAFRRYKRFSIIPLYRYTDTKTIKGHKVRLGKRPLDFNWTKRRYNQTGSSVIARCIKEGRNMGIRLLPTELVIDVDPRNGGDEGFADLVMDYGLDESKFPKVITGSGGFHLYGAKPEDVLIVDSLKAYPGVEFKSKGRQVVAAGSIHPDTKKYYEFSEDNPPIEEGLPEFSPDFLRAITRPERSGEAVGGGQYDQEQLARALDKLDATEFKDHSDWLTLMMACHHATNGDGREEFIEWSTTDPDYADHAEIIGRRWDLLHAERDSAITYQTLNMILADHGAADATLAPENAGADFEGAEDSFEDDSWLEGGGADEQPLVKLSRVTKDTIDHMFKLVNMGGKVCVQYWGKFALDPKVRVPQFWSLASFKLALKNKTVTVTTKEKDEDGNDSEKRKVMPLADWWLNSRSRYTYDGLIFDAKKEEPSSPDEINLWRGFAVEPNPAGVWDLMREHIRKVIASGNEEWFAYIMNWLAYAVQHPTEHCEIMLLLLSENHGTGKGFLGRALCKLFGSHGMQVSKSKLVTGQFNAHLQMVGLLFVDEASLKNSDETGAFNTLISEPTLTVEPKGIDAYTMPNVTKVIAASNQKQAVIASGDERRIAAFEVSDVHAQDHPYFKKITAELEAGGYGAMLHELLNRQLGDWHPRDNVPQTGALTTQKVESAPPQLQWIASYLDCGVLPAQVDKHPEIVGASDFYNHARRTVAALYPWSDYAFAAFLKELGVRRRRSNGSRWTFPPLADMRRTWKAKYPWWPAFDKSITEWHSGDEGEPIEETDGLDEFG